MIPPVDRAIERFLKSSLYARRDSFVNPTMARVEAEHELTEQQKMDLRAKLEDEIVRIYPIIDASILRANIIKARYYFWFITTVATLYVGGTKGFSSKEALNLLAPLAGSIPVWLASWGTIPIFYNQRIEGAMNSVVAKYISDLAKASRRSGVSDASNDPQAIAQSSVIDFSIFSCVENHQPDKRNLNDRLIMTIV